MNTDAVHGGLTDAERETFGARGIEPVDLSASLNPYGPHPAVLAAAQRAPFHQYPSVSAAPLVQRYAQEHGVAVSQVIAGNGSSELIYLVARAFGAAGGTAVIMGPTFGEYSAAAAAAGMAVAEVRAMPEDGFIANLDAVLAETARLRPRLVFVCTPNNPTGRALPDGAIETLTAAVATCGGRLLVDEAYVDFAACAGALPSTARLVLRSLTKLHAIPGLRLGFLLGMPGDVDAVRRQQPPWAVSAPALAAGLQALRERAFAADSIKRVTATRGRLVEHLREAGLAVTPSEANFVLVNVGDGVAFRDRMLDRGFAVRDCKSFGLPGHVRIAIPREDQLGRLLSAMDVNR